MALVKFISGDGVEHEVEGDSLAAGVMRQNGFTEVGAVKVDDLPESPEITYTEEDAIAQNDGEDVTAEKVSEVEPVPEVSEVAEAPTKAPAKKKANA